MNLGGCTFALLDETAAHGFTQSTVASCDNRTFDVFDCCGRHGDVCCRAYLIGCTMEDFQPASLNGMVVGVGCEALKIIFKVYTVLNMICNSSLLPRTNCDEWMRKVVCCADVGRLDIDVLSRRLAALYTFLACPQSEPICQALMVCDH